MSDSAVAFAPGRVNLVGEHTDYNGGLCLPFAIERGVTVTARRRAGAAIVARARDLGECDRFALVDEPPARAPGWRAFVRGTVAELRAAGHRVTGAELEIAGDLERGAGLSTSAALEVALALALLALVGEAEPDRVALACLCSRVENDWFGAPTGLLDQLAVLCARPGTALLLDLRGEPALTPVALELGDWRLATLSSGATHDHVAGGYDQRRAECHAAARALGLASLRDATPAAGRRLPAPLDRRVRHVLAENARVEAAVAALRAGDLSALGRLLDASHASLRDDFDCSAPAVEDAVARARAAGATGARMIGGGFGGTVLALFAPDVAPPADAVPVRPSRAAHLLARE